MRSDAELSQFLRIFLPTLSNPPVYLFQVTKYVVFDEVSNSNNSLTII